MRIVFCGSGTFAIPSLLAILETDHDVTGVVTQPPRRAGRGGKLKETPIALLAREQGLVCLAPQDINAPESVEAIRELAPDVICVVEFGQMIRKTVRDLAKLDSFNLHASILPELRGAAPVNWAIIRGYEKTGVSTFSLVDKLDAGPVYLRATIDILPEENALELRERLAGFGADAVVRTLGMLAAGWAQPDEQNHAKSTYGPRMSKSDGIIYWSGPAKRINDLIRGTWPWPGAHAVFSPEHGKMTPVTIAEAKVVPCRYAAEPGMIDEDLNVCTGLERLRILQLKPAGKRLMTWKDFVNGHHVSHGDRFARVEGARYV